MQKKKKKKKVSGIELVFALKYQSIVHSCLKILMYHLFHKHFKTAIHIVLNVKEKL